MHIDSLLDLIAAQLSVEEILDILGWDIPELVEALRDDIRRNKEAFIEATT